MHFVSELIHLLLLHRGVSLTFAKDWAFSKGPKFSCEANVYTLKPCWHLLSIHVCMHSFARVSRAAMGPALCDGLTQCDKVGKEHRFPLMSWGSSGFRSSLITSQEQRAGLFSDGPVHWVLGTLATCPNHLMASACAGAMCSTGVPPLWTGAYVHIYP